VVLFYRNDLAGSRRISLRLTLPVHFSQRLDLFAWCVRLSRLLVGFRTHFKALRIHSFIHSQSV